MMCTEWAVPLARFVSSLPRSEHVDTRDMSDEILVDVDGAVTTIGVHGPHEHPALGDRPPTGALGDMLGIRYDEFR